MLCVAGTAFHPRRSAAAVATSARAGTRDSLYHFGIREGPVGTPTGPHAFPFRYDRGLLPPLVREREHWVLPVTHVHAHVNGVVVRHLGYRAPRRHLPVLAGALADHGQRLLRRVVAPLHGHRRGGHAVEPDADILLLVAVIGVQALAVELLPAEVALHRPN